MGGASLTWALFIISGVFAASTALLGYAVWRVLLWRMRADRDSAVVVPDALFDRLDASDARLVGLERALSELMDARESLGKELQQLEEGFGIALLRLAEQIDRDGLKQSERIDGRLKEINENIGGIRTLAEERGAELERYREGYNLAAIRSLALGVIKTVDNIEDYEAQLAGQAASGEDEPVLAGALARLEATRDQLVMLLESNHIEAFLPSLGDSVEESSRRLNPVETRPASSAEEVGRIAEVKHRGYVLMIGDSEERVLREARVSVFAAVEGEAAPDE